MPSKPAGHLLGPAFERAASLAPCAVKASESRGRLYPEQESPTRTCYQRDRDRVIHSSAFRRLKHKTQVFVQHEGDLYRTRLTHSLEVAQIARSLARVLALDEDLAETISLSHDLGHTPFGHAGEDALNDVTADIGGFDHNAHALKLVTELEHRYAAFNGLNLTWETLEGLVKHNGPLFAPLPEPIASFDTIWPLELQGWPGLEAQLAALSDDIAYLNHDLDDGLRAGLFSEDDLRHAPLAAAYAEDVLTAYERLEMSRFIGETVHRLMSALVTDLIGETRRRIAAAGVSSAAAVRQFPGALAGFSSEMMGQVLALKAFLFERMYRHPKVMESVSKAKQVIQTLFAELSADPNLLPADWAALCGSPGDCATAAVVRDYIAGMTDRFALAEHAKITHTEIAL